ncbi:cytochrome P450 [Dietzia aurantiaca]|uniref:Cytochrome P450 n=1 Tax=Dietzia aurantiaca TaxID=983873 RepID=A0ABV9PUC9_9ACTN
MTERAAEFSSNLTASMVIDEHGAITEFPVAGLGSPIRALATADGDTHRIHRTLVLPSLTRRRLRAWAPFVDETIRQLWAESYDDGTDWVTEIAETAPVVAELVGVSQHLRDQLLTSAFASFAILDGVVSRDELDDAVNSVGQLMAFLDEELHRPRVVLPPTVVGDLARLVNNSDIDHDVATHILVQLIVAGIESTVGHLVSLAWPLGQRPEHLATMRDDPPRRDEFIEEVIRLDAPFVGHYRHVVGDTVLGGTRLPAGSRLFLLRGHANRDEQHFNRPDEFLPGRDDGAHLSLGRGIHFCVGAALARLESRTALDFLLEHDADLHIDTNAPQWHQSLLARRLRSSRLTVRQADIRNRAMV